MKINSVTTEALNKHRQVLATSVFKYNKDKKPSLRFGIGVYQQVEDVIKRHMSNDESNSDVKWFCVTVKCTKGKYIQTYAKGCFK